MKSCRLRQRCRAADYGSGDKLHLTLFDFSLARTPPENVYAGTVGYLDPFLNRRDPPVWDLHAERYAAAVTLFELATGKLPRWEGGNSPKAVDCEAKIDPEQFTSSARDRLVKFFTTALQRDRFRPWSWSWSCSWSWSGPGPGLGWGPGWGPGGIL